MSGNLVFADQTTPGITRKARGKGWAYFDCEGNRITDRGEIDRLNAIALPPAYVDCWYSPNPDAHLLATGVDARGRKQYRYHPQFRLQQEALKFECLIGFGEALADIRRRVESDAAMRRLTRDRAIACVVRLLDAGALRVGNECYARVNRTFGATTLRRRHLKLEKGVMRLRYRAKSGKMRELRLTDRTLLRFVRQMQDLPGQHLFQFVDEDGEPVPVTSCDVNDYLREITGGDFTAKHFRTWAASVTAFETAITVDPAPPIREIAARAASVLANTPAIARKSYIHPAIIALAQDKAALADLRARPLPRKTRWLTRPERAFLAYLKETQDASRDLLAA